MRIQKAIQILQKFDANLQHGVMLRGSGVTTAIKTVSSYVLRNARRKR